ncbi:hypothetical protein LMIY3S_02230 [Labrys miyagiensis]
MASKLRHERVWLNGQETGLTLERSFWSALEQIAKRRRRSVECLLHEIEETQPRRALRTAVIEFVLSNA